MTLANGNPPKYKETKLEKELVKIANKHIIALENRKTLKALYSDDLDFVEISVWELEESLKAAYELGRKSVGGKL